MHIAGMDLQEARLSCAIPGCREVGDDALPKQDSPQIHSWDTY